MVYSLCFNSNLEINKKKHGCMHHYCMRRSYFTLQLLYYRSWVSRIKYTHVKAGTWNTRNKEHTDSRNIEHTGYGIHGTWNTLNSLLSVLKVVTHTHPTIQSMFIPPQRLIRPPGCNYSHETYCWMGSRMMSDNRLEFG